MGGTEGFSDRADWTVHSECKLDRRFSMSWSISGHVSILLDNSRRCCGCCEHNLPSPGTLTCTHTLAFTLAITLAITISRFLATARYFYSATAPLAPA
jgi:hypothetical protein